MTRPVSGRRRVLGALLAASATGLAGCSSVISAPKRRVSEATPAGGTPASARDVVVGLERVATVPDWPLAFAIPPAGGYPRYVALRRGLVLALDSDGLRETPFLDLREVVSTGIEQGLLGLTLHPDFEANRRLFVRYSAPSREGTPANYDHTEVLAEFRATEDGSRALVESERTLLEVPEPHAPHNAGDLAFGPDGYLYVPLGDGGGENDAGRGHAEDWYAGLPGGNGQDVSANLLGSVLRIDVDSRSGDLPYGIPRDNPLVGRAGLDEQFAWGFRNPWRLGFSGGRLFVGDVGQEHYEEVDLVERGGNYGWNVMEGRHCYLRDACPQSAPPDVRGGEPLRLPVVEYPNGKGSNAPESGSAVVCGYLYDGSALPALVGRFVFADWLAMGRLFVATPESDGRWPVRALEVAASDRSALQRVYAFERDPEGELFVLATGQGEAHGVFELVEGG